MHPRAILVVFLCLLAIVIFVRPGGPQQEQQPDQPNVPPEPKIAAAHILIMHKRSKRAPMSIQRNRDEARELAKHVAQLAHAKGSEFSDFAELVKEHSDDFNTKDKGGTLGAFPPSSMTKVFSETAMKLKVGEVSEPVETEYGFHIIRRLPVFKAKHILIMWKELAKAQEQGVTRSEKQAEDLVAELQQKLAAGAKFEDLAVDYSDGPSGPRGGDLGEFTYGSMVGDFETAVVNLKPGEVSDVVETEFGFHLIKRY